MKRSGVQSDSSAITPTGPVLKHPVPMGDAVAAVLPVLSSPAGPASLRVEPAEPVPPAETVPPVEPESAVEGVLSVLYGARDVVARASRVPLDGGGCDTLADVIDVASRLRSAVDAVVLSATAALEAARPGSGRSALVGRARVSKRNAKRTVESGEQIAHMPNVARGLAAGELNAEHAAVLADAARRTSPDAIDTAEELLQAAAVVSPEALRDQAKKFAARHDPAAAETALARQRRARCTSLFVDESTGMGVLHAELDPVSFALMRQALENYTDALWRLDGGRDATPGQIRDNRQRLADSLFEMTTDRNALATIDHPTVHRPNHNRHPQSDDRHSDADRNPNTNHGRGPSNADRGHNTDTGHGGHSETGRSPNSDHGGGGHSDAGRGRNTDTGHGGRSDAMPAAAAATMPAAMAVPRARRVARSISGGPPRHPTSSSSSPRSASSTAPNPTEPAKCSAPDPSRPQSWTTSHLIPASQAHCSTRMARSCGSDAAAGTPAPPSSSPSQYATAAACCAAHPCTAATTTTSTNGQPTTASQTCPIWQPFAATATTSSTSPTSASSGAQPPGNGTPRTEPTPPAKPAKQQRQDHLDPTPLAATALHGRGHGSSSASGAPSVTS